MMRCARPVNQLSAGLLLFLLIFPLLSPLLMLFSSGAIARLGELASLRRLVLLAESVTGSAGVAAAATLFALALGLGCPPRRVQWYIGLALLAALIPPYLHALAWLVLADALNGLAGQPLLPVSGRLISGWVEFLAFSPYAIGCAMAGFAAVPTAMLEAARMQTNEANTAQRVVLPQVLPFAAVGGMAVFIFSLLDYSVPSLFSVNTYALELFADFSATGAAGRSFVLALPVFALALLAGGLALRLTLPAGKSPVRPGHYPELRLAGGWLAAHRIAAVVAAVMVAAPALTLMVTAGDPTGVYAVMAATAAELRFSGLVAAASALLAVVAGCVLANPLRGPGRSARWWWWLLLLVLAAPAPLVGVGLITTWNSVLPLGLYGTMAMPVLAGFARFTPWAALIIVFYRAGLTDDLFDAARVARPDSLWRWLRIDLPLLLPGLAAAWMAVFALTCGELGATILVVPPGSATVTMRIYNYLHYGASDMVAGLALTVLAAAALAAGLLLRGMQRAWQG